MKRLFVWSLLMLAALALAACSSGGSAASGPAAATGDAAAGKSKFDGTCVSCHGPDAKGMPGLGKDLTVSEFVRAQSDAELVSFLSTGRQSSDPANSTGVDMPPKGGNPALTEADLYDIVAYLRSLP